MTLCPRVSVLMPVRNEERHVHAALRSMLRQTLQDWELIAVDDGSSDGTAGILAEAAATDARIRIINGTGSGLVDALNRGLNVCRAPLLARMDGDDISHPQRLLRQAAFLDSHPHVGLVACCFRHFPRTGLKQGMVAYETWQNSLLEHDAIMRDRFVESPFVHPSIMVRRGIVEMAGGYQSNGWAEDYDLLLRLSEHGVQFARLNETLFFWRDHATRSTRTNVDYSPVAFRDCKLNFLCRDFLKGATAVTIAGAGQEGRAWQRILSKNGITVTRWLDVDPRKLGRHLHGAPVLSTACVPDIEDKILVAIGVRGAREQFRSLAADFGLCEGEHFICVA